MILSRLVAHLVTVHGFLAGRAFHEPDGEEDTPTARGMPAKTHQDRLHALG